MENLAWGLQMTLLGMGLVFALLGLLWGLLTLVLLFDKDAEAVASSGAATAPAEPGAALADDAVAAPIDAMPPDLVAAIVVATLRHRLTLRRQAAPIMRNSWPGNESFASRWVAVGRARQNTTWQSRGK